MASRRIARVIGVAAVAVGAAVSVIAWRAGLPANTLVASLAAGVAGAWLILREEGSGEPGPPTEADTVRLDQERERRTLQAFLDQAPTPLVVLQLDGTLSAVNRAARQVFRADSVLADPGGDLHRAILESSPDGRRTVRLSSADGLTRAYALSVAEVVGAGGAVRLAAFTDIEAEIQAAEAAALKELLQILSHELMNSLTPLASLAQTAVEQLDQGELEQAKESVGIVARRSEGLHRFVEAYRTLARLPPPVPREVSLAGVLDEAARLFQTRWESQGVTLEAKRLSPDIVIRLDPDLTGQALLGLLTNAAEAALAGKASPTVRLSARPSGGGAAITVSDTGEGVDAGMAAEIFRPFVTTKPGGSGIGLSLARQAIVSQGGQLVLEAPRAGEGARFTIAL